MGEFVADATIKQLVLSGKAVRDAKVVVLGVTFKEDCPDTRNSKVDDIVNRLNEYGIKPVMVDPEADAADYTREYGKELTALENVNDADCIILAVAHKTFKEMTLEQLDKLYANGDNSEKVLIDVKSILDKEEVENAGYRYWRL